MTQRIPYSNPRFNKSISPEQLNEIIEAILAGKYSWACVLLLRCAGYNPLHYIPYRTYNRLLKENCQIGRPQEGETNKINAGGKSAQSQSNSAVAGKHLRLITDLTYLEDANEDNSHIKGGKQFLKFDSLKITTFSAKD